MPIPLLRLLTLSLAVLPLAGCSWIPYAIDNVHNSFTRPFREHKFTQVCKRLAEEAWAIESDSPRCLFKHSKSDYEKGFKAGFVDYLDCNGSGEPPAAPPRSLRWNILRNPDEQQNIYDWFAGFRHGAATAAQAEWRERIVVPISQEPNTPEEKFGVEIIPRYGTKLEPNAVPGAATFDPPLPQKIDNVTDGIAVFD